MSEVFLPDNIQISQEKFVAIAQEWPVITDHRSFFVIPG